VQDDAPATDQEEPQRHRQDDGGGRDDVLVVRDGPCGRGNRRDGVTDGCSDLAVIDRRILRSGPEPEAQRHDQKRATRKAPGKRTERATATAGFHDDHRKGPSVRMKPPSPVQMSLHGDRLSPIYHRL
jgi:hypothetical protein